MDFKTRALRFGLTDKSQFREGEVKRALNAQGFADVTIQSGPS